MTNQIGLTETWYAVPWRLMIGLQVVFHVRLIQPGQKKQKK